MSRKLRELKPKKVNRGAFEEQKKREESQTETQIALLYILPLVMLALLIIGIFFGYKFYLDKGQSGSIISSAEVTESPLSADPMLLRPVNTASPLSSDYEPVLIESCGVKVSQSVGDNLQKLKGAAAEKGFDLIISQGYISYEEQKEKYNEAVESYRKSSKATLVMAEAHVRQEIPSAGESEQQTGLVVYISVKTDGRFVDTQAYSWLLRNCVDYGFIQRYPDTVNVGGMSFSSHLFRFVGQENASMMRLLDMNFDEYVEYTSAK